MIHEHHRKRRSQGGDDSPANVIRIPDVLHQRIHDEPAWAYDNGLLVKGTDDPAKVQITIPEDVVKKPRAQKKPEEKRNRRVISVRVPADSKENGAEVFETLLEGCREKLDLASGGASGAYIVLVAVMHEFITNH